MKKRKKHSRHEKVKNQWIFIEIYSKTCGFIGKDGPFGNRSCLENRGASLVIVFFFAIEGRRILGNEVEDSRRKKCSTKIWQCLPTGHLNY